MYKKNDINNSWYIFCLITNIKTLKVVLSNIDVYSDTEDTENIVNCTKSLIMKKT